MSDHWDHWDDGMCDKAVTDKPLNAPLTDFEKKLEYFGFDEDDWDNLSNSDRANCNWNYKSFGKSRQ